MLLAGLIVAVYLVVFTLSIHMNLYSFFEDIFVTGALGFGPDWQYPLGLAWLLLERLNVLPVLRWSGYRRV